MTTPRPKPKPEPKPALAPTPAPTPIAPDDRRRKTSLAAGIGFLLAFLGFAAVGSLLADDPLPQPDAATSEVVHYYANNASAAVITGVLMLLCALALAVFLRSAGNTVIREGRARAAAWTAAALLTVSAVLGFALAGFTSDLSGDTVELLRDANFVSGGTLHVAALGLFALFTCRAAGDATPIGRGAARFGHVAGGVAVLSLLSLVVPAVSPLIPVGRVLVMAWVITVAVGALNAAEPGAGRQPRQAD
ncbi:hypothetical protein [Streptomyces sp. NPDC002851]